MKTSGILPLALAGLIAGIFSIFLTSVSLFVLGFAGLPFGLLTAIALQKTFSKLKFFFWILLSAISYGLAVQATLLFAPVDLVANPLPMNYTLGGLTGAFLLGLSFHFLVRKLKLVEHFLVIILGGAIAFLASNFMDINQENFIRVLYFVWNFLIASLFGIFFDRGTS